MFKKLEEQGIDPVLWGLTDKDFELLAKNFAQIRNQLKITNALLAKNFAQIRNKLVETNALLDKYKEYYEEEEEKDNNE